MARPIHTTIAPKATPRKQKAKETARKANAVHRRSRGIGVGKICQISSFTEDFGHLAEGVGFEPTVPLQARRFSRPVD
jgi:hypothetical protein